MNSQPHKTTTDKHQSTKRTLFLDRDGVINRRLVKRYVKSWEEFEFLPGVLEAIPLLNQYFNRTFVVTNQRGIGLGLMSVEELNKIHQRLMAEVESRGGYIDRIYFCEKQLDEKPNCRKPEAFMALQAQKDFPEIDFKRSIMVGDQPSDIAFGMNLGMKTVWIPNDPDIQWEEAHFRPDHQFGSLEDLTKYIRQIRPL